MTPAYSELERRLAEMVMSLLSSSRHLLAVTEEHVDDLPEAVGAAWESMDADWEHVRNLMYGVEAEHGPIPDPDTDQAVTS